MRSRQQLINLRIMHVTILLACALFIYQYSQWDDGLWVPITVLAIIGPFKPGLSMAKAKQRVLGSIAGLLLSILIWFLIHYNYNLLLIVALVLVYCIAFAALQEYTYFIMLVTIMLCVNFDYMNLLFNNELVYLANRGICVLCGVLLCHLFEYGVFKHSYHNAVSLVEKEKLDQLVVSSWQTINRLSTAGKIHVAQLNRILQAILECLQELSELRESCLQGYSDQRETLALIEHYQVKLSSLYAWISQIAYTLLSENPQVEIEHGVTLSEEYASSSHSCD